MGMKWTTHKGREINVSDMEPSHAYNAITMLIRNNNPNDVLQCILKGKEVFDNEPVVKKEPTLNGEMAQLFNNMEEECEMYASEFDEDDFYGIV